GAADRRTRVVVHEHLVRQAAQVDAELRLEPHRYQDAGHVGEAADDGLLLGALESFVVAGHRSSSGTSGASGPGRPRSMRRTGRTRVRTVPRSPYPLPP